MRTRKSNDINLPTSATEDAFHLAVAELLELVLRMPTFWTTFPAGYGKLGKATAGKLKAKGLKAGMPDIMVFHPCGSYTTKVVGLELKAGRNTTTSKQRTTHELLRAAGVYCYTIRTLNDVLAALISENIPYKQLLVQESKLAENVIRPTQVELPI